MESTANLDPSHMYRYLQAPLNFPLNLIYRKFVCFFTRLDRENVRQLGTFATSDLIIEMWQYTEFPHIRPSLE